jgi:hypothetical protein
MKPIFNSDLPNVFEQLIYTPQPEDIGHKLVWYVDPAFFKGHCKAWTIDTVENPKLIKKMGFVTPNLSKKLDAIFISYDELNAEENWVRLQQRFAGNNLYRVHGIKGIFEAHKAAAELATTDMFYVVDADAWILDNWNFSFTPNVFDRNYVHIFRSRNPVNGLEYGNGGVKIFPKKCFENTPGIDVSTTLGSVKVVDTTVCETRFNSSAFSAWRAGFREACKLSARIIKNQITEETDSRLSVWKSVGADTPFGKFVIEGAIYGEEFAKINPIHVINDYSWLKDKYESIYGNT